MQVTVKDNQLLVETQFGNWSIPDSMENRKVFLIILRGLVDSETDKHVFTFQTLADAFDFSDRRDVNNYWRQFISCNHNFLDFLVRKRKVDQTVVDTVESILVSNLFLSTNELCRRTNVALGRTDLTDANICVALAQIPGSAVRKALFRNWDKGRFQPKEAPLLEEVMSSLSSDDSSEKENALQLMSAIEVAPQSDTSEESVQDSQWKWIPALLTPGFSVSDIPVKVQMMVVALSLSYWNIPFSRIAIWLGISKGTAYNWVIGISVAIWMVIHHWLPDKIAAQIVYIDEKWLKIKGKWFYWFVALDDQTGLPVLAELLPCQTKWGCMWFLLKLKQLGKSPKVIITDGLSGYISAIAKVFPQTKHLTCIFHFTQNVTTWLKKNLKSVSDSTRNTLKKKMKRVVQTTDSRTTHRRLDTLEKQNKANEWGIQNWIKTVRNKINRLIPALRDNTYPKTTNTVERFFRAFNRFYKTRGGFHSKESAKKELMVFLVGYLFTIQVGTGKAPIETIIPKAKEMPLFKLINDPLKYIKMSSQNISPGFSGLGEMATGSVKVRA